MFPKAALLFSVLAAALTANTAPIAPRQGGFQLSNGQAAQALNAKFATLSETSACQDGEQACLKGGFAQCVGGKFQVTGCAGGTQCFALPLVNKAGTSVTCDTEADALARIAATGATGGLTGGGAAAGGAGAGAAGGDKGANNAGAGAAAGQGAATAAAGAAAADATKAAIDALSAAGGLPPVLNKAASIAIAGAAADAAKQAQANGAAPPAANPTPAAPVNDAGAGAAAGAGAGAPAQPAATPAPAAGAGGFKLSNGQAAQALNKQFASLNAGSSCKDGDQACVNGQFAQCVGGKFQVTGCSGGTKCFALPLVNKAGTSITCDTEADALARIAETGATGGLTGA